MSQIINNQKLISSSKAMLLIFRILFVILILMTIIPWIAPTNGISKFLLSMTYFPRSIWATHPQSFGQNVDIIIDDFLLHISLLSRFLGFIGTLICLLPLLIGTKIMIHLTKNYASGNIFNLENARSYSKLGLTYLFSALLLQPFSQIILSLCVSLDNPVGHRTIAFGIDISNLTAIFFAITLIIIGHVMKWGQKISEEQELTV
jgi:hypothetical protein